MLDAVEGGSLDARSLCRRLRPRLPGGEGMVRAVAGIGTDLYRHSDTEAVWQLGERRWLVVEQHAQHAGHAVQTIFVDDLDARWGRSPSAASSRSSGRPTRATCARWSSMTPTATRSIRFWGDHLLTAVRLSEREHICPGARLQERDVQWSLPDGVVDAHEPVEPAIQDGCQEIDAVGEVPRHGREFELRSRSRHPPLRAICCPGEIGTCE